MMRFGAAMSRNVVAGNVESQFAQEAFPYNRQVLVERVATRVGQCLEHAVDHGGILATRYCAVYFLELAFIVMYLFQDYAFWVLQ